MSVKRKFNEVLAYILPFIGMGIALVLLLIGIVIVSYVLLWGALIGLVLFFIAYIKRRFFPSKNSAVTTHRVGKTFDQDER